MRALLVPRTGTRGPARVPACGARASARGRAPPSSMRVAVDQQPRAPGTSMRDAVSGVRPHRQAELAREHVRRRPTWSRWWCVTTIATRHAPRRRQRRAPTRSTRAARPRTASRARRGARRARRARSCSCASPAGASACAPRKDAIDARQLPRADRHEARYRSTTTASASPPPMQRLARPRFALRSFIAWSERRERGARRVAPMGCPSATAPPRTLTFCGSRPAELAAGHRDDREGLVDLVEVDLVLREARASRTVSSIAFAGAVVNHSGACAAPP